MYIGMDIKIINYRLTKRNRDSSVGILTECWLGGRVSIISKGENVSSLHSFQRGSEAHLVSYVMGTGDSFLWVETTGA
jgi:hypothetical protein